MLFWSILSLLIISFQPAAKKAETFYTDDGRIYAPNGEEFIARGVNKMFFFNDRTGVRSYPQIARTGANCVRIFWFTSGTAAELDSNLANCVRERMVAIPSVWEATGKWERLIDCVDYWCRPDIVAVIQKYRRYLLLNIANEAGNNDVDTAAYRTAYVNAVQRLRSAGLTVPLVVDAAGWGRKESYLLEQGPAILDADPLHRVIFSWHPWDPNQPQSRIREAVQGSRQKKLPFLIAEFSEKSVGCSCCIDYRYIVSYCAEAGCGWLAWSWGPGNGDCAEMDMTRDNQFESLHGWGLDVAVTLPGSIRNTAQRPDIFNAPLPQP